MNLITHIDISKTLYTNLTDIMDLDKTAFIYGNIKPDLTSKLLRNPHTLENYFLIVCNNADKLMNSKLSLQEFSFELGQICHYVCDFFCQYHLDNELFHKFGEHFVYELKLHFELLINSSKINKKPEIKAVKQNIYSIIKELRNEYFERPPLMLKDLEYAFVAALWICESIHYFSHNSAAVSAGQKSDASYLTLPIAGGQ